MGLGSTREYPAGDGVRYRVVETSIVTDDEIERVLNQTTAAGWSFDSIQFVMREASRRPAMAFLFFVRAEEPGDSEPG